MTTILAQAQECATATTWPDVALGALIVGLIGWFFYLILR